jgi:hypothetical protein
MKKIIVFLLLFGQVVFAIIGTSVWADSHSTKGLRLSPLRNEISIAPGTSRDGTLDLTNQTDKPMTVHLSAEKFSVVNEQYDYAFTAESDTAKWITYKQDDVTLEPGKSQTVPYMIGVPLTAEPGGRYISLFATTDAQGDTGDVKSQQRIASLVYLTVEGKVTRVGKVVSLNQPWLTSGQDKWTMELQDSGTTHYRSQFSVQVQTLFGSKIGSYTADALILPASVRSLTGVLPAPQLPGLYQAVYTIGLGDAPAVHQTRLLLYVPLWSVGALLVLIGMIVATVYYVRSLRKKHR